MDQVRASSPIIVLGRYIDIVHWDGMIWRNPARADRVIAFIECLTIPSGVGAGGPFLLREWQKKFIRDIYEPVGIDLTRLVRDAVLSMGRKNGKTAIIAALVLVHLCGPESIDYGEIYSAANDRDQAAIVYKFVAQFVHADPELDYDRGGLCKVVDSTKRITCPSNGSFYRALSREAGTKHGLNPSFAIYDELAQSKDRDLYDTLNTAFAAREEPLFAVISTQSRDPQHILSELIDRGLSTDDPTVVCHLYAVPDEIADHRYCEACATRFDIKDLKFCPQCRGDLISGIWDESTWYLANPALDDFLSLEAVRKLGNQARESPSFEPSFRNLSLNQRVDLTPSVVSVGDWRACQTDNAALELGEDIYLGLDLSATTDLAALVAVSAFNGDRVAAWFWKPGDLIDLHSTRDRAPYERWRLEGYLTAEPGRDVDYDLIALQINDIASDYNILGIAFDRWRIETLMKCFTRLGIDAYYQKDDEHDSDGIRFVPWGQGFKDMAPAIDTLDKAIASRTFAHGGNPVLTWCVSNAVVTTDAAGNRKLDKSKTRFRIDGAVAMVEALGLKARDMMEADEDISAFLSRPIGVKA